MAMKEQTWTVQQAREVYNITRWSGGYFDIDAQGYLVVCGSHTSIRLHELAEHLRRQGYGLPILVRFNHILRDRVNTLCNAFARAIQALHYQGDYTSVYPIKVNQQRPVVSQILSTDQQVGLEAGSKPELLAVIALSKMNGLIICNGYKDREYIRLALIAGQLGLRVFVVVEKLSELALIIGESQALGVHPQLGVRVRLASIGAGKWQNTGGEKSKFGLSATQVLAAIERLKAAHLLDSLQLLHCHLGSQIANIHDIHRGMGELARYYGELRRLGVPLRYVDVGGGLGIDYEGTASRSDCSINYTTDEYAQAVIQALWQQCQQHHLPHPNIVTEAGRALTAHHAVLITEVIDHETIDAELPTHLEDESPVLLKNLWQVYEKSEQRAVESYHEAVHWLSEAQSLYIHGLFTLEQRAVAERLYYAICQRVQRQLNPQVRTQRSLLDELNDKLADKFFVNFSVFQSIPDVWALDQIFPIMPLQRLDAEPNRRVVLHDLTCDSDGRIDHYVDGAGIENTLPLPAYDPNQPYRLGIFLVGAYQEILGDMHNLFGDTDAVNVELTADGQYHLVDPEHGDTVADLLRYVHFEPEALLAAYRAKALAVDLTPTLRSNYLDALAAGLQGSTYLE